MVSTFVSTRDVQVRNNDMEDRLQVILQSIGSIEISQRAQNEKTKREKMLERIQKQQLENFQVDPRIRLKRFLYYGDERPLYQPGVRLCKDIKFPVDQTSPENYRSLGMLNYLFTRIRDKEEKEKSTEKEDKKKEPVVLEPEDVPTLSMIIEALKDPSNPHPECAIICLAECARQMADNQEISTLIYRVAREHLVTFKQLCSFIRFYTFLKMKWNTVVKDKEKGSTAGWGGGLRRLVCHWYAQQRPLELARAVCHRASEYGWSHKHLIRLAHFKPKDHGVALQAVVVYALRGYKTAEEEFGNNKDAEAVMIEFRIREKELSADPETLAKLVESHKLKPYEVPSHKLNNVLVWTALLKNMDAAEILEYMSRLTILQIAGAEQIRKEAAIALTKEGQGANVTPVDVYISLRDYHMQLKTKGRIHISSYVETKQKTSRFPVREPCVSLVEALGSLLTASFKAIQPAGVRVLLALDLRDFESKHCTWTHSLTPLQAMAVTALSLARTHKRFTLTYFVEAQEMQIISVPKSASIDSLLEKFKELQATAAKIPQLSEPMTWARERKRDLDLFVIMTPELTSWNFSDVGKSLQNYRETVKKPDARLAINPVCHMSLHIASPHSPGIFDIAGFGPRTIQILNCIAHGKI